MLPGVTAAPLRHLISGYSLFAAWIIVFAALAATVSYGLLQPAPPPGGEPASIAMPATFPEVAPPGRLPAAQAGLPAVAAGSGDEAATPEEEPQAAAGAEVAVAPPAESAGAADPAGAQGPQSTTATVGTEEGTAPAEPSADQGIVDGDEKTIALPQAKPEQPVESAGTQPSGETVTAEATAAENAVPTAPQTQQAIQVPLVPPSPEELPYWERYRQPFNTADPRPRIAVVLTGLGLSDSATQAAIDRLPAAVTLSFSPYARGLERWIALARARGHEVMLDLPMEPATFPNEDPGPQALLTSLSEEDNLDRLDWVLSRGSAYVGVAGAMGSRFTASRQHMQTVLSELKSRGLIFLDNRTTDRSVASLVAAEVGLQSAFNNRSIDERQASRLAIDARLAQIERIALSEGFAVAMAQPYPVTLNRLVDWSTELTTRGFVIAPISALVNRQERR